MICHWDSHGTIKRFMQVPALHSRFYNWLGRWRETNATEGGDQNTSEKCKVTHSSIISICLSELIRIKRKEGQPYFWNQNTTSNFKGFHLKKQPRWQTPTNNSSSHSETFLGYLSHLQSSFTACKNVNNRCFHSLKNVCRTEAQTPCNTCPSLTTPHHPQSVYKPGMTHTSVLTLAYMAPLRTSPLRIQMIEAAGLALSAWQVRLSGSPALRLTTGPPLMTGSSGGTIDTDTEKSGGGG